MVKLKTNELPTGDASRLTGYSENRLRGLARKRWVRARKKGRKWLFDQETLQARRAGWIGTREASDLTGYSENHLRSLARKAQVPARKLGRRWGFNRSALRSALKAHGPSGSGEGRPGGPSGPGEGLPG